MSMMSRVFLLVCVLTALGPSRDCAAETLSALFARLEPSVVKVTCSDIGATATGFVWNESDTIVTALHVVDGSEDIQVYYPVQRVRRRAHVVKVFAAADLVLLRVNDPPEVAALRHRPDTPGIDEDVHALGFQLNASSINSFTFKLRYGGRRLEDNVSSLVVARLRRNGYPSPGLEVVKLGQESLLPGLSGAPIFNGRGEVVAVGDGGLEEGAINISWGVPARNLDSLLASAVSKTPGASGTRELFAAELQLEVGKTVAAGEVELVKLRTRSFQEIAASADDQMGLHQLAAIFSNFELSSFVYDIYQDVGSGATVVVPQGAEIKPAAEGLWVVRVPGGRHLDVVMSVTKGGSVNEAQRQSVQFEEKLAQKYLRVTWQADPQWSYAMASTRFDGLVVRRKAAYGLVWANGMWLNDKYMFETVAARGGVFVGLAVINNDANPQSAYTEAMCAQGYFLPDCSRLFEARETWAQIVLGVHMTSFSL